jgi:hypothetical protein
MEASAPDDPIEVLRRTRPWLGLLGMALLLGAAFTVLAGLALIAIGIVAAGMLAEEGEAHVGPALAFLGLLLFPVALAYVYPGILLLRAAGRIPQAGAERSEVAAEAAIKLQGRFWRYVGIVALLAVCFQALLLILFACLLFGSTG